MSDMQRVSGNEAGEVYESPRPLSDAENILATWNRYRGDDILNLAPRRWLAAGWLPLDAVVAVYSPPGVGKSFYALTLGLEVARGGRWCGTRLASPLPVIYAAAERPTDQRDRAEAWSIHHNEPLPPLFELYDFPRTPMLSNSTDVEALCIAIKATGAKVVIIDTYARMTAGIDENATRETSLMMDALDRIRRATSGGVVIAVHHTPKDPTKGLRGSSAFLGAVDMAILLSKENEQIRATVEKSNAGREPLPEWYSLQSLSLAPLPGEVERRDGAVLIHTGAPVVSQTVSTHILDLLRESDEGLSMPQLIAAMLDAHGLKMTRHTLTPHLKSLEASKYLLIEGQARTTRYKATSANLLLSADDDAHI